MLKILKYSFYDLIRSRWSYVYLAFYFILSIVMLFLNASLSKAILTLMNVVILLVPLIGTIFGVMYYYSSKEFTELLLALPIKRSSIFLGQFLGVAISLSLSLILGLGIPFVIYGLFESSEIWDFGLLLVLGTFLSFIFSGISYIIALMNENKIKGFGYAILMWLFFAVIYDGLFLISLIVFEEYPLDTFSLVASIFNPIDLSRIMMLLKLDISALLGYTGAVFRQFFGSNLGSIVAFGMLCVWTLVPILFLKWKSSKKDF
ncbi:MAG: ABC transporter permease [Brumimicrobium sp.]